MSQFGQKARRFSATEAIRAAGLALLLACNGAPKTSSDADLPALPAPVAEQAGSPRGAEKGVRQALVALVGEVRGEIEPCGCPTLPYGGFARRERLLEQLRAEGQPLFHLDAGELLLKGVSTAGRGDDEGRTALLLDLERTVGVDVWVPGPTDLLALGAEGLTKLSGGLGQTAVISATWTDMEGKPLLPPSTVVERGGLRLGVIGLSGAPTGRESRKQVRGLDPVAAATEAIRALPPGLDLVVGLGSITDEDADRVATGVPGLSAVLSTRGRAYDEPRTPASGSTPVIEAPDRGRYVAALRLRLGTTGDQPVLLAPEARAWRDLAGLQRSTDAETSPKETALVARFEELGRGRNLGYVEALPLGSQLDGEAKVNVQVDRFKDKVLSEAARAAATPKGPHSAAYTSNGSCVNCHTSEFARWAFTDHARTWEALVSRKRAYDPECVGCHTTGFGKPGGLGTLTPANLRRWKGVQCESCHGPMAGHPNDERVKSVPITPSTCLGCHDAANSPDFDYASYLPRATCQGGAPDKGEVPGGEPAAPP